MSPGVVPVTQSDSRFIASADGTPLLVRRRAGDAPQGPVLLLGHGPSVHSGLLGPAMGAFAAGAAAVWAGDLRGHGGSVSARAPLAHLDPVQGWAQLIDDMAALAREAFRDVPRARRVLVGGAFSGHVMLELLARDPDLAGHLVMAAPSPQQPGLTRIGAAFLRLRAMTRPIDRPDPQLLHHVFGFLRAQLPPGTTSIDTISADPAVVRAIQEDPRGFPTPTPGYWSAVLPSMSTMWTRIERGALPSDLRVLVLSGPQDAQTRGGRLLPRVVEWFRARDVPDVRAQMIDGVRANVLIDAPRLPVAEAVLDWFAGRPAAGAPAAVAPAPPSDISQAYEPALQALGLAPQGGLPPMPVLIDLCYAALDDESRWIELIYRLALAGEAEGDVDVDRVLEALHPHWQRAFELREELRQAASLGRLYTDLIDRLDLGVAVLDAEGRMRHANPAFARLLERIDPGAPSSPEDWLRRMLTTAPAATGPGGDVPLVVDGQAVGVCFVPASLRGGVLGAEPVGRLVVLRLPSAERADLAHRAGLLSLAYGLTGQEGAAALHLSEGLTTEAAARAMGVSENTLRSHLKQVFDKMGVSSRTELSHRVLAGPLGWLAAAGGSGLIEARPPPPRRTRSSPG